MPYIERNTDGLVISLKQVADENHREFLAPTHTEIVEFLAGACQLDHAKNTLQESDHDFARATEDLIHLLVQKNIILFTELPSAVQQKILGREKLRSNLNGNTDNFLDDGESI